ncbi:nuclear transport factor 2 family protein [Undibacterium terreum]|uniref:DUF4440 domain-containing protein n=1 Tax=Undibacterium terreum TaxID=1224302 RepID=A0A916U5N7_9BURK|nr:nuclear transport factor 2 family protein [Undibacterium terreum]GGC60357.1 hypothetical protein GCM10011396_04030 [Undibacterium terreum]
MNKQLSLFDILTAQAHCLLQAETQANACALDKLVDDAFIEFAHCGRTSRKAELLRRSPACPVLELVPENFKLNELIPGLAQLSFQLKSVNPVSGEVGHILRCSIWKRTGQNWKLVFQQVMPARYQQNDD